jgi:hypothetical protein
LPFAAFGALATMMLVDFGGRCTIACNRWEPGRAAQS